MNNQITYEIAKDIYRSMSNSDRLFISPRQNYDKGDKSSLIFRTGDNDCFVDVYQDLQNEDSNYGFIVIGVRPEARGKGLASKHLRDAIEIAKSKRLDGLIYKYDKWNIPSEKLVDKFPEFLTVKNDSDSVEKVLDFRKELIGNLGNWFKRTFV